ncbi:hypothetical protein PR202_gb00495 [Eleusine coracana subsp. coracana]|uniref:Peptidase A1 domain-containing protein n=1 Tax=Eleusine coracana subsp. coracana TaxID=191504 RepID=A0AAV5DS08_ELECO|nr:hypothetical protein PR202_gb00495 [Eleusine coracana subsp. coracana]
MALRRADFSPKQLKNGAFHFPVFHIKHPCIDEPSSVHAASVSDAGTVIGNDNIHTGKYFMAISLGAPAVFNLVTIDTGSTLSWVQCEKCHVRCHDQAPQAGKIFNPNNSTTYSHVGCYNEDCIDLHEVYNVPFGCIEETDTCLYSLREDNMFKAGIIGFGNKSYSFFNQLARKTSYNAFAYCFPIDHKSEGFLTIAP